MSPIQPIDTKPLIRTFLLRSISVLLCANIFRSSMYAAEKAGIVTRFQNMMTMNIVAIFWFSLLVFISIRMMKELILKERETSTFLDAIVENVPTMIFLKDAKNLAFVKHNKAGQNLLGLSPEELYGKNDYDFFPKDQAEFFIKKDREVLESGILKDIPEEPILTKNLGLRYLHTKKIPIFDGQGKATHLLGVSEDITDLKILEAQRQQHEAELTETNRKLEVAYKELESFSYAVSHDLKGPANRVRIFSQLAKTEPENITYFIDRIESVAKQMQSIIEDLLLLAKIGQGDVVRAPVSITKIATETINSLKEEAPQRKVSVLIEPDLVVSGDERLVKQLLINLLSNAWKFTSKLEHAVISVTGKDDTICVTDNGAGMDMRYSAKLFKPFQRLHTEAEFPGSGIGLSIVKKIIDRHGGKISVESTVNHGTTFTFNL